jgi:hypothetical protein
MTLPLINEGLRGTLLNAQLTCTVTLERIACIL